MNKLIRTKKGNYITYRKWLQFRVHAPQYDRGDKVWPVYHPPTRVIKITTYMNESLCSIIRESIYLYFHPFAK